MGVAARTRPVCMSPSTSSDSSPMNSPTPHLIGSLPGSSTLTHPSRITKSPAPSSPGCMSTCPAGRSTSAASCETCQSPTSSSPANIGIARNDSARSRSSSAIPAQHRRPCPQGPRAAMLQPVRAPSFNLADLWETLCDADDAPECLVAGPVRHTRGSLDAAANRVANHLVATGIRPGDHVGIYARNRAEYIEALFGCWKCGAIPVNINWRYVAAELRYVIDDARLVAMIVEDEFLPVLEEVAFTNRVSIGAWADAPATSEFDGVPRSSDDVYMLYTGGTTGMPKGVMWRHEDFFYACCLGGNIFDPIKTPAEIARNAKPAFSMSPLVLGPLMHGGGQWLTLISLFCGNRAVVYAERHFAADAVLDLAARENVTTVGIIGDAMARPLAEAMLAEPGRWDLSSIIAMGNGGAMLSAAVKSQLTEAFPGAIVNDSYGASETGAAGSEVGASTTRDRPAFTTD